MALYIQYVPCVCLRWPRPETMRFISLWLIGKRLKSGSRVSARVGLKHELQSSQLFLLHVTSILSKALA